DVRIYIDTAILFTFHGRRYSYIDASMYNCNGSGCLETYHFIADFTTKKLYQFVMFAEPSLATPYFGDVNNDGQLDFVVPEYVSVGVSGLPYSDTTEEMELKPYTLNKSRRFVPITDENKQEYFLIGQFDGGNFTPRDFRIIAARWWD
ncbi:MAG TPA: hypothetical protein VN721_14525, partial [Flavipsychrobacter sp.]|nr:hypothetical protein [Flavipsychrobacter sp.]